MSTLEKDALGRSLKMAQLALKNAMEAKFRALDLTLPQYAVLSQLALKEGQTNAELARNAFITPQSMQGILSNMETSGLIERKADQEHGRRQPARLTPTGAEKLTKARDLSQEAEDTLLRAVAPLNPEDVLALFQRIHQSLSEL
ncbi:MAG: MarR family transcriptional regulator [Aliishimia sp.]